MKSLLIAGTHSGVGKTTVALALMAALRRRGLGVQPFKVGPDFIDPGHHTAVCGRVSRNLDTWMLTEETVRRTFFAARRDADMAVVEGVMGLFDGALHSPLGTGEGAGSTADLARLLGVPIILVVDAGAMASSVAAVVKGFSEFHPEVKVVGVICNRVAGPRHYEYLEPAIRRHTSVVPLGWLPRNEEWKIPERHLGLMTADDLRAEEGRWEKLAEGLEQTVDIDGLLELASGGRQPPVDDASLLELASGGRQPPVDDESTRMSLATGGSRPPLANKIFRRVAVARDAAFCFYYPENLELLEQAGAEITPFSPLTDSSLPDKIDLLYLGGGYPELRSDRLSGNASMRQSIRSYHQAGGAIYAECGGLMYCCRELVDASGKAWPMLDLLPARTVMQARRSALGYVTLRTTRPTPLGPAGTVARGHEFHYSRLEPLGELVTAAELDDGRAQRPDGILRGNLYAGYAHLHFGSNPEVAAALLRRPPPPDALAAS